METGREKTEGQDYKCICRDRTQIDQTDMGTLLGRLRVKKIGTLMTGDRDETEAG